MGQWFLGAQPGPATSLARTRSGGAGVGEVGGRGARVARWEGGSLVWARQVGGLPVGARRGGGRGHLPCCMGGLLQVPGQLQEVWVALLHLLQQDMSGESRCGHTLAPGMAEPRAMGAVPPPARGAAGSRGSAGTWSP